MNKEIGKLTLEDLAVEHDYYCSDNNYYSSDAGLQYPTFADFYEEFKDADVDMNLVFRWDLRKSGDHEGYYLEIFQMQQRRGKFVPIYIELFEEKDIPQFVAYLQPHIEKLKNIWKPFEF